MAKTKGKRQMKTLICDVCKEENYRVEKNKRNTPERLELKKHCPKCNKTTLHKEKK